MRRRNWMRDLSDEGLMANIAEGDRGAFEQLVTRHLNRAIALAQRITGNRSDAEEVAQEAFLRVWQTAPRWRLDGALFRTWFSRVLVNLCIDRKRRPGFAPLEAAGDPPDPGIGAENALARDEEAAAVAQAVAELPERQRAALALCYWQEMSNVEAAEVLALSVGAVESLLVRARRTLRQKLGPRLGHAMEERP
ncbi:MAG TPA: RNA polymerase sigma factor [Candidatus Cybelea sp.]|nr:RNA polymerase sigma factor [Candidatus Cybelea sp.]